MQKTVKKVDRSAHGPLKPIDALVDLIEARMPDRRIDAGRTRAIRPIAIADNRYRAQRRFRPQFFANLAGDRLNVGRVEVALLREKCGEQKTIAQRIDTPRDAVR